ncbi:MAG: multidrug resistance efflux pump, partial [Phycisphaerales bacterium]|nr:multidrug resistance efflux pump [Phycisphaerales bacterium]
MMSATMRVHLFTLVCITFLTAPTFAEETPPAADAHRHWAFVPPVRPTPPVVKNAAWVRNPIDAFLAAEHGKRGLTPRPEADKATLLRRVYLDLIGIPPTRQELHAFLADESADSFEKVVDRLLASPAYGERWGRHWLDVWRYSDWAGFMAEVRDSQPFVWRWRDWAVESLNADKGYDRMVQEMLAGDELAPDDPQTIRATGYLARNWYKFNRNVWLENTVEHTSKAF